MCAYDNNFKNAVNTLLDDYVKATIKPSLYNNPPWHFGREGIKPNTIAC